MKVLVRSSCTAAEMGWGDVALVEIYPEFLEKLVAHKALIEQLRKNDGALEVTFWAANCWWYDHVCVEDDDQMTELGFSEEQRERLAVDDYLVLPADFSFGEDDEDSKVEECRTGADKLVVVERGFYFRAYVKHADSADVETWVIPWDAVICPIHGVDKEAERTCLRCVATR